MSSRLANEKRSLWALGLLSAAALAFEITLTRLFAVAQFYHFAFMIVSLALLGSGASGTFLTFFSHRRQTRAHLDPRRVLALCGWGFGLSVLGSYLLIRTLPFDSFRIAHDWRQMLVLASHYIALATPFFWSGLAVGWLLAGHARQEGRIYAVNLGGSAVGCLLAVVLPALVGGEGAVLVVAALGGTAALICGSGRGLAGAAWARVPFVAIQGAVVTLLVLGALYPPGWLDIALSPYKSLSYLRLIPGAEPVSQRWNSFSRVDVIRSNSIRSLPGSGFSCRERPPAQLGLTVDGDGLNPISHVEPGFAELPFTGCLLTALPYRLRPGARALILEPGGGFDLLVALSEGARHATAVEANPLVVDAVRQQGAWAGSLYDDPRVDLVVRQGRSFVRQTRARYDVIALALTAPQRTVVSGAYSLVEDYTRTVEAFVDDVERLDENGLLVVVRWLQVPPSESIRAFALAVEAIARTGGDPQTDLVALRSYQQMLIMARRGPFTASELESIRDFAAARAFDLVYLPGIRPDEVNRYNVLPQPDYYRACLGLLQAPDRARWYAAYPFDVEPPHDNRPFFAHFFKWRQARQVLVMAGHTWQPFGGAGYFVLLALLALALLAAGLLILLPLAVGWRSGRHRPGKGAHSAILNLAESRLQPVRTVIYFSCLGLGYLCIEIPLMQHFTLFLGYPAWSLSAVLFALLLFSGIGSRLSHRLPLWAALCAIPVLAGGYAVGLPRLFDLALAAPLWAKVGLTTAVLAPLGVLMGMPFPKGVALLRQVDSHRPKPLLREGEGADALASHRPEPLLREEAGALIAWAWASNGAMSVVASVLAALLALSWGFSSVLAVGAASYLAAWWASRGLGSVDI